MGLTLAAMLGQIGLPGGGFGHGYGSMNEPGLPPLRCGLPRLPQGPNPVHDVHPGRGDQRHAAASRRAVRLQRPATDAIPTSSWCTGPAATRSTTTRTCPGCAARWAASTPSWCTTRTGRRWPSTPTSSCRRPPRFERDDFSGSRNDPLLMAMPSADRAVRAVPRRLRRPSPRWPTGSAFGEQFTEGRTARQWLAHMYDKWAAGLGFRGADVRRVLARTGRLRLPTEDGLTLLADFRADPEAHRLDTPSGRIEIFSADIDGFGYDDCAGHPTWFEPTEWLGGSRAGALSAAPAGQPAGDPAAQPARRRRRQPGFESARARTDPDASRRRRGSRARRRRRGAGVQRPRRLPGRRGGRRPAASARWCSCRPARGSTRPTPPTRMRCACTATRTCSPTTSARHRWRAGAPARMCWCRWRSSPARCHRCGRISRRCLAVR